LEEEMPRASRTKAIALALSAFLLASGGHAAEPEEAAAPAEEEGLGQDLVILRSGLAIEGKILRQAKQTVELEVEYGVLSIPRAAVESVELNLASRLKELAEDDHLGRYRLAVSALEAGQTRQAKPILESLVGKPKVPPEVTRRLAELYESEGDLGKALEHWKTYALSAKDDAAVKAKIAELEKKLGGAGAEEVGKPAAGANEGLETGGKWNVLNWGNPAEIGARSLDGNSVLMVEVPGGGTKDKTAIGRSVKLDLAGKGRLRFRAFSAENTRVDVAVAIITSVDYYESRPVGVAPNWNLDLSIDLRAKTFKCKATNWRFESGVNGLDRVRQLLFLIYSGRRKVRLYFDAIRAE
jgi:hypothetical protein